MPLTFVHPAAVLPLMRGPLVPTALVAGALAPDVPYFLRALDVPVSAQSWWEPFFNATTTHGWPGAVTVAVPLALVLHLALVLGERPARWALASTWSTGETPLRRGPLWVVQLAVSLALGVLTHLLWDSFTHSDGWIVQHATVLRVDLGASLTVARLLQHLSTALGLIVLLVVGWRRCRSWFVSSDSVRRARALRWTAVVVASALVGVIALVLVRHEAGAGAEHLLASAAIGAGLGVAGAAIVLSLLWWMIRPDRRVASSTRS